MLLNCGVADPMVVGGHDNNVGAAVVVGAGAMLMVGGASAGLTLYKGSDLTAVTIGGLVSDAAESDEDVVIPDPGCDITIHCLLMQAFFNLPGPPYRFWSRQLRH